MSELNDAINGCGYLITYLKSPRLGRELSETLP